MPKSQIIGRAWLADRGFVGFVSIAELRAANLEHVPPVPGVYAVLRASATQPEFLERNPGGRFKGRNPTVSLAKLEGRWFATSHLIYLGKAGTPRGRVTLKSRVRSLLAFGAGSPVGHWGGRLIWQIAAAEDHLVAWRTTGPASPRTLEKDLLAVFESEAGQLPFANLLH